jgi:S-adenosylmethionine decarboxylase
MPSPEAKAEINLQGVHYVIDGSECDREKIGSEEAILDFLTNLPDQIGMTKISEPRVQRFQSEYHQAELIHGYIMIAESHISVQTIPERGQLMTDIFSCKPFDKEKVLEIVMDTFQPQGVGQAEMNRDMAKIRAAFLKDLR